MKRYQYDFLIADIPIRWYSDFPLKLHERYQPFLSKEKREPEAIWHIHIGIPKTIEGHQKLLYEDSQCRITRGEKYQYRMFPYDTSSQKRTIVQKRNIEEKKHYWLYLPKGTQQYFQNAKSWIFYMAFEELLYSKNRILLHASYVDTKEGAILFSGPSGVGKSTQAALWQKYYGSVIENGDRAVIVREKDGFAAMGSPYAGTSGIYRNCRSSIRAIVILEQAEENQLSRMRGIGALRALYRESLFSYMDEQMKQNHMELLLDLLETVPVYHYQCRKDISAVKMLQKELDRISNNKGMEKRY